MAVGKLDKINLSEPSAGRERMEKTREDQLGPGPVARDHRVDEVAKLYEKQFLREMVKAMRGSSELGYMKPSMGEKIYREELDNQYVEAWGEQGGVGLQNMIYDQMMERYFTKGQVAALKGPGGLPLTNKDVLHVQPITSAKKSEMPLKIELKENNDGSPVQIQMPWDGKLLSHSRLLDGKTAVQVEHAGGFRSTFIFDGVFSAPKDSESVKQGSSIGTLSPEVRSFFWNLTNHSEPPASQTAAASSSVPRPEDSL